MSNTSDFTIVDGVLKAYNGRGGDVVVPDGVVEIYVLAFANNNDITSVTLPGTVERILFSAFSSCEKLTHVSIPKSTSYIDRQAFFGSKRLADQDGFVVINDVLFNYYGNDESITIPPQVVRINEEVFARKKVSSVVFPSTLREIGKCAFLNCDQLTELVLPESVVVIEEQAFQGCKGIRRVSFPQKMGKIGESAFSGCDHLAEVQIPQGINTIEAFSFSQCVRLQRIVFSETVKSIGRKAFLQCSCLSEIQLPNKLEEISDNAFERCNRIEEIIIPDTVSIIGKEAFKCCSQLHRIKLPKRLQRLGEDAFLECDSLQDGLADEKDMLCVAQTLYKYYGDSPAVSVPNGFTTIGKGAFAGNKTLSEVILPESIEMIDELAFGGCTNLKRIILPSRLRCIGSRAFACCESLETIVIPDNVSVIESGAFCNCNGLRSISLPLSLKMIKPEAFQECSSLTKVELPVGIEAIGSRAFYYCKKLKQITIPGSVKEYGYQFLNGCYCEIYLDTWNKQFTERVSELYLDTIHVENLASVPSKYKLPIALTFIKEKNKDLSTPRAKAYIKYLSTNSAKMAAEAINEPDLLAFLCEYHLIKAKDIDCFISEATSEKDSSALNKLLDYRSQLGDAAVEKAQKEKMEGENKGKAIVADRLAKRTQADGIKGLTFALAGRLDTSYSSAWQSRDELEAYLHHYGAKTASNVSSSTDYVVLLDEKTTSAKEKAEHLGIQILTPDEFNIMVGKRFAEAEHVIVPEWMDFIPARAFGYCYGHTNTMLKAVDLPETITRIEHGAFQDCEELIEITVPESVTSIGYSAFSRCKKLQKVTLPEGLKEIGERAFYGCELLSEINIPNGVVIDGKAFQGCKSLRDSNGFVVFHKTLYGSLFQPSIILPNGVKHIGKQLLFANNGFYRGPENPVEEVSFPDGLLTIGEEAFRGCTRITKLILPESLEKIDQSAFAYCRGLKRIWIPANVTFIGKDAFASCSKLRIHTPPGSCAEQYARENSIRFVSSDRESFIKKT